MITITLAMIVKNEEEVLARCLYSVKDLVDEIIIVDTGSTDKTIEIARNFTDKIFNFEWINDFSAARNYAFSLATKEYIMWLDADDILHSDQHEKFKRLKRELSPEVDIVMLRYLTVIDEDGKPVESLFRERILKREKNYQWVEPVHEQIDVKGNIKAYGITITHGPKNRTHFTRNLLILEKQENLSIRGIFNYGRELQVNKRYEDAIVQYNKFLEDTRGESMIDYTETKVIACYLLADCYLYLGDILSCVKWLKQSCSYKPAQPEACCRIGEYYFEKKDYEQALLWTKKALDCQHYEVTGFTKPQYKELIPHLQLTKIYAKLAKIELAYFHHQEAKKLNPNHPSILYNEDHFKKLR